MDVVQNIIKDYSHLANSGKTIILCWIPSHVNIRGNDMADTAAKSALSLPITNMKLPARELIPCISKFCLDEWQDIWDWCEGNKLYSIYPLLALSSIAKIYPATIPSYSTDSELVILVSLSHTYCVVMTPNLSILWNSTYSKTHISGMCQLAGHSLKIRHGVFCRRLT